MMPHNLGVQVPQGRSAQYTAPQGRRRLGNSAFVPAPDGAASDAHCVPAGLVRPILGGAIRGFLRPAGVVTPGYPRRRFAPARRACGAGPFGTEPLRGCPISGLGPIRIIDASRRFRRRKPT